jgi:carotenoid 1,2-hydratase
MTERGRAALHRERDLLVIGPSSLQWDGSSLVLDLKEWGVPLPRRIRGRIRVHPTGLGRRVFGLDAAGRHRWMPIAPAARVEVSMADPACSWQGHGYCDTNGGDEPIESAFSSWSWSRAPMAGGRSAMLYDVVERDGARRSIAARYAADGEDEDFAPPPRVKLGTTAWGIRRETQAEAGSTPRVVRTLENTPFYARSELATRLLGEDVAAVHESMNCERFDTPWVRLMLPWRMPRQVF